MMKQSAPYPSQLSNLVELVQYKQGWEFSLRDMDRGQGSKGLTLVISIIGPDSYHPERNIRVDHYMPVPPAAYEVRSWTRWLFDQVLLVEQHEAMEFFRFPASQVGGQDERPYAPNHGPGNNPYTIPEYREDIDRRTSFTGEVNDH
jgi:hypothetical protein